MYENAKGNTDKVVKRLSMFGIRATGGNGEITLELVSNENHKPITLPTDEMEALLDKACASMSKDLPDVAKVIRGHLLAWYIMDYGSKK